jgi:hypothetical protein
VEKNDNEKYMELMAQYKEARGSLGPEANRYLRAAQELSRKGSVSPEVILGSAYL